MKRNTLVRTLGGDTCVAVGFMEDGALVQVRKLGGTFSPIWLLASALKKVPNPAEAVVEYINNKLVGGGAMEWAGECGVNGVTVSGRKTIAVEFDDGQTVDYNYRDVIEHISFRQVI